MRGSAWLMLDLAAVLVFVIIGRSVHTHGDSITGIVSTSWPFLAGLVAGWITIFFSERWLVSVRSGIVAVISTVAIGMILRVIGDQGTAVAFVFVALGFLGALMLGWRAVYLGIGSVRSRGFQGTVEARGPQVHTETTFENPANDHIE
jgi:Protein of unknown function (DUF3054)